MARGTENRPCEIAISSHSSNPHHEVWQPYVPLTAGLLESRDDELL